MTSTPARLPFPDRDRWDAVNCSVARTLELIGPRSALLLLREAFFGTRRFDDFHRRVGVTEAVAAARLRELVDAGLLARRPYQDPGRRTRQEYVLTERGRELFPVLVALMEWGDRRLADPQGPPVSVLHADCGAPVHAEVRCAHGHPVGLREAAVVAGPGARPATDQPVTDQPVTDQPVTDQPVTDQPVTDQPATARPSTGRPR